VRYFSVLRSQCLSGYPSNHIIINTEMSLATVVQETRDMKLKETLFCSEKVQSRT